MHGEMTSFYDYSVPNKTYLQYIIMIYNFIEKQNSEVVPLVIFAYPPAPQVVLGPLFSSIGALEVQMSVGRSVGLSVGLSVDTLLFLVFYGIL